MLKLFFLTNSLLLIMLTSMGLHYTLADRDNVSNNINAMVAMTGISSLSLSVAYYEPRISVAKNSANIIYPEMMSIDRMDFVYAK